jgi:N-acetylneuraminic acid mutarotase
MPTGRFALTAAELDGTVYAIGGATAGCSATGAVEGLNTATGTWTTKMPMATPRSSASAVSLKGKIFVLGGADCGNFFSTVEVYDPATNTWSAAAPMPTNRALHAAVALNGKIYVTGGAALGADGLFFFPTTLDVYDPDIDTWSTKKPLPAPRAVHAAVALDGLIYVVGGLGDMSTTVYNPASDTWTEKGAKFPDPRGDLTAAVFNGALYALGGTDASGLLALSRVDQYDVLNDAWIAGLPMLEARADFAVVSVGGALYAIGGQSDSEGIRVLRSVEVYTVAAADKVAPETVAVASPVPNAAGWNNTNVSVTLTASDNEAGSGVKSITYKVVDAAGFSGATVNGSTASIVVSIEGVSTITFRAVDNANNVGVERTHVVRIDKTAPLATLTLSPNVLWPPNNKMVKIRQSLSTSDSSGMPLVISGPAVASNEPPSAAGDWRVIGGELQLRATRKSKRTGRVYTVTYTVTDIAGNSTNVTATVTVPHRRPHHHDRHKHHDGDKDD